MSDLIVLAFNSEDGALQLRDKLLSLQKQMLIQLEDAAVVVRRQDGKVKVKQLHSLVGAGALGGAFWGMLIGLIFWMPWPFLGPARPCAMAIRVLISSTIMAGILRPGWRDPSWIPAAIITS